MLSPAEYYESCKGQTRYMRDVEGTFEAALAKGERKRLQRLEREGFYVGFGDIAFAWQMIAENRRSKGRVYSMGLGDWMALDLEGHAISFSVFPEPIACALCVRPRPDTLYVQGWSDAPNQQQRSPVILLAKGIYNYCATNGIKILDIGTAEGAGLISFKERLGFKGVIL